MDNFSTNFDTFLSYLWVNGNEVSGEADSILVSPQQTTEYIVSAWDNTCYAFTPFTDTIPVIVNVPVIDAGEEVAIIRGETALLSVSGDPEYLVRLLQVRCYSSWWPHSLGWHLCGGWPEQTNNKGRCGSGGGI